MTEKKAAKQSTTESCVRDVAWRAQLRLCSRYRRLIALGKKSPVVCAAIARELATFIWEMGQIVALTA